MKNLIHDSVMIKNNNKYLLITTVYKYIIYIDKKTYSYISF